MRKKGQDNHGHSQRISVFIYKKQLSVLKISKSRSARAGASDPLHIARQGFVGMGVRVCIWLCRCILGYVGVRVCFGLCGFAGRLWAEWVWVCSHVNSTYIL